MHLCRASGRVGRDPDPRAAPELKEVPFTHPLKEMQAPASPCHPCIEGYPLRSRGVCPRTPRRALRPGEARPPRATAHAPTSPRFRARRGEAGRGEARPPRPIEATLPSCSRITRPEARQGEVTDLCRLAVLQGGARRGETLLAKGLASHRPPFDGRKRMLGFRSIEGRKRGRSRAAASGRGVLAYLTASAHGRWRPRQSAFALLVCFIGQQASLD